MTREDILSVYNAGPDAVIGLVEGLVARIAELEGTLTMLSVRVQELEGRLAKDSHNSSKPPSSDHPTRKPKSLRQKSGKPPGGQPGHKGHTLRMVEEPDEVCVHAPDACEQCGASLETQEGQMQERRQVFDLPPLRLWVQEHQAQARRCPDCGHVTTGGFPLGVGDPVQYGPRIKALGVYLQGYQLLPYERTREVLFDLFGAAPCAGTLHRAFESCAMNLAEITQAIKDRIMGSKQVRFDETGGRVGGKRWWMHAASTEAFTHYQLHAKRGKQALDVIGILPGFQGRAMHDGYSSYFGYGCLHALCNAHHLRELTFLEEQHHQPWAGEMKALLLESKAAVEAAIAQELTHLEAECLQELDARYTRILATGFAMNPTPATPQGPKKPGRQKQSPAKNLLDRLERYRCETLAFAHDFEVPFDNNLAERDLRMLKVQQKVSGGFRTEEGGQAFCRVRGYISTLRKQAQPVLEALLSAFTPHPVRPPLMA